MSRIKGKQRVRCDVCLRQVFYVSRLVSPMSLRPFHERASTGRAPVSFEAGALLCEKCVSFNAVERQSNPLPMKKPGKSLTGVRRRPVQAVIAGTVTDPEAHRIRASASELRAVADVFVSQRRMGQTAERLRSMADELAVIALAADIDVPRVALAPARPSDEQLDLKAGGS